MATEYVVRATRNGYRFQRRNSKTRKKHPNAIRFADELTEQGEAIAHRQSARNGRTDRPISVFTNKSRMEMRWTFNALPWGELPGRLALITLTMPKDWRRWCPDGETWRAQIRRYTQRWRDTFDVLQGSWIKEFQPRLRQEPRFRGAPHLHTYVSCPDEPWRDLEEWIKKSWFDIVGSGDRYHRAMGADVRPAAYGAATEDEAKLKEFNARKVGDYFWRESGKWGQKEPPEAFTNFGAWWRYWGMKPQEQELVIERHVWVEGRRVALLHRDKNAGRKVRRPVGMDGCQVVNVDGFGTAVPLLRWAEGEADAKRAARFSSNQAD